MHRFQSLRVDLLPTSELPSAFFSPVVVKEIRRRVERSQWRLAAARGLWGDETHECCVCMQAIAPEHASSLEGCGHLFHTSCILQWLGVAGQGGGGGRQCPLCRAPSTVAEVMLVVEQP